MAAAKQTLEWKEVHFICTPLFAGTESTKHGTESIERIFTRAHGQQC